MGKSLNEIAQELKSCNKKVQLIYAFNGTGKTRLSLEFKNLIQNLDTNEDGTGSLTRDKILYYNAFTEDLFYWDNDFIENLGRVLQIQPNRFISWLITDSGLEERIAENFRHYTNDKLTPVFIRRLDIDGNLLRGNGSKEIIDGICFSYQQGNDGSTEKFEGIKISKGEESNFIWSIFYSLLELVIEELNIPEPEDRSTADFDALEYVFIDDPVTSLDENHLIEVASNLGALIKSCESDVRFIITTHNPLFYNVLYNELKKSQRLRLEKLEDSTYELIRQDDDSPFAYHLFLKNELNTAIKNNDIQKYHFNFLRNLYEKTSTFLGYEKWTDLLPDDGSKKNYEARVVNISSHSRHSEDEYPELNPQEKQMLVYLFKEFEKTYHFSEV
ncbi:AAA family ATPase [Lactovum odontotermitis]